jgi:ribonucleoside-diphosphate reductase alpha chain
MGATVEAIVEELEHLQCPQVSIVSKSCPDAVASVLRDSMRQDGGTVYTIGETHSGSIPINLRQAESFAESFIGRVTEVKPIAIPSGFLPGPTISRGGTPCPECGTRMNMEEGCMTCRNCGYSKCS